MTLINGLKQLNIEYDEQKLKQIEDYYNLLIEKNKVMNLTRITDREDFYVKHVLDSLLLSQIINLSDQKIIDIGTGAGFPGIPIKIFFPDVEITLLDSLNKRISFLDEVIEKTGLKKIYTIHGRAEDYGKNPEFRESFDISVSRAVADLSVLSELCIPFVKKDCFFVAYKSSEIDKELIKAKNAINILSGSDPYINKIKVPCSDIVRNMVIIKKKIYTPKLYPRNPGIPSKKPL